MNDRTVKTAVKRLLAQQHYGVLATESDNGTPHLALMAFASVDDLAGIVCVTPRHTRKFTHICQRPAVAFLVDDRNEHSDRLMSIITVEAQGCAAELTPERIPDYRALFLAKYPHLSDFVTATSSVMLRIAVERYDVVDHFQQVLVLPVTKSGGGVIWPSSQ